MGKKALITWGGWEGHEPEQCAKIVKQILDSEGFDVVLADTLDCFLDDKIMTSVSLIVPVWTMSSISDEQSRSLLDAVSEGVGIAGFHGGMGDSFRNNTEYQWMVGGQWVAHPGNIMDYKVHIEKQKDPVVAGIGDFSVHSEQYYMHTDPGNEVLATTVFSGEHAEWIEGTVMPVVWKRHFGSGRVFYSSLGHSASEFEVYEIREILKRGMLWAAR